jgi:hypothetical protein
MPKRSQQIIEPGARPVAEADAVAGVDGTER